MLLFEIYVLNMLKYIIQIGICKYFFHFCFATLCLLQPYVFKGAFPIIHFFCFQEKYFCKNPVIDISH